MLLVSSAISVKLHRLISKSFQSILHIIKVYNTHVKIMYERHDLCTNMLAIQLRILIKQKWKSVNSSSINKSLFRCYQLLVHWLSSFFLLLLLFLFCILHSNFYLSVYMKEKRKPSIEGKNSIKQYFKGRLNRILSF